MALDLKTIRSMTKDIEKDKEKEKERKKAVENHIYSQLATVTKKLALHRKQAEKKAEFEDGNYSYDLPESVVIKKELEKAEKEVGDCMQQINNHYREHEQREVIFKNMLNATKYNYLDEPNVPMPTSAQRTVSMHEYYTNISKDVREYLAGKVKEAEERLAQYDYRVTPKLHESTRVKWDSVMERHKERLSICQARVANVQQAREEFIRRLSYPGLLTAAELHEAQTLYTELNTLYMAVGLAYTCKNCKKKLAYGEDHDASEEGGSGTISVRYRC